MARAECKLPELRFSFLVSVIEGLSTLPEIPLLFNAKLGFWKGRQRTIKKTTGRVKTSRILCLYQPSIYKLGLTFLNHVLSQML
jgi:hypothetical protein